MFACSVVTPRAAHHAIQVHGLLSCYTRHKSKIAEWECQGTSAETLGIWCQMAFGASTSLIIF